MFTDTFKHILVTCDTCGNYIDHLEVGIGVFHSGRIASKQWKIDENLNVFVWQIKAVNSKLITWQEYDKNGVMEGQRIDSYYRIDLNGKFLKTREVKYTTRNYPFTFFDFPKSFLWDNKDTVISDEKIFR